MEDDDRLTSLHSIGAPEIYETALSVPDQIVTEATSTVNSREEIDIHREEKEPALDTEEEALVRIRSRPHRPAIIQNIVKLFNTCGGSIISITDFRDFLYLGQGEEAIAISGLPRDRTPAQKTQINRVAIRTLEERQPTFGLSRKARNEISIMQKAGRHDRVVSLYSYFKEMGYLYIMLEFLPGRSLKSLKETRSRRGMFTLPEMYCLQVAEQILFVLMYFQSIRVAHCDLSLDNIIDVRTWIDVEKVGFPNINIIDFGKALGWKQGAREVLLEEHNCTKPGYAPPEMASGMRVDPRFIDIYHLGAILYILISGTMPFDGMTRSSNGKDQIPFESLFDTEKFDSVHPDTKQLLRDCLNPVQSNRPSPHRAFVAVRKLLDPLGRTNFNKRIIPVPSTLPSTDL